MTADFIAYESVYLPKNHFIKEKSLSTENYLSYFYPFDKLDFRKNSMESQKEYAERYDWLAKEFTNSQIRTAICVNAERIFIGNELPEEYTESFRYSILLYLKVLGQESGNRFPNGK